MSEIKSPTLNGSGVNVLTITATFPSLIQPWLVNQLVQIGKNGGGNYILARRAEKYIYTEDVDRYDLLVNYHLIPESRYGLVKAFLGSMMSVSGFKHLVRGFTKYPRLLMSRQFTVSEKCYSFFLLPYFGLKNISIVHSHSEMAGSKFLPIVFALGVPLVITFHGLPPVGVKPISKTQRKRYTSLASKIFVNTEFAKRQYQSLDVEGDKIQILPQGINVPDFPFQLKRFPGGEINVLTVGRFHPDKGQVYAIEAVAALVERGVNIKYHLVGNGPQREMLEQLCDDKGISGRVEFYSSVTDGELREIYSKSHIFILPSLKSTDGFHEETQGVVLQEAQASGLIVIATKAGGIPECIDDGVSGFLVEDRSSVAIQQALQKLISEPEEWETYQKAGLKWVDSRYNIDVIGKKIATAYRTVIDDFE